MIPNVRVFVRDYGDERGRYILLLGNMVRGAGHHRCLDIYKSIPICFDYLIIVFGTMSAGVWSIMCGEKSSFHGHEILFVGVSGEGHCIMLDWIPLFGAIFLFPSGNWWYAIITVNIINFKANPIVVCGFKYCFPTDCKFMQLGV